MSAVSRRFLYQVANSLERPFTCRAKGLLPHEYCMGKYMRCYTEHAERGLASLQILPHFPRKIRK